MRSDLCDRTPTSLSAALAPLDPIPEHDAFVAVRVMADGAPQTPQIDGQVVLPVTYAKPRATASPPRVTEV